MPAGRRAAPELTGPTPPLDSFSMRVARMAERREQRAWPCTVAAWLAKPAAAAPGDAGSWLVSKSPGEVAIEVIGDGAVVKVGVGDAELAAGPLERGRFACALVSEALLAGCAAGPGGQLTFTCSFFTTENAMECASVLAAWLCPPGSSGDAPQIEAQSRAEGDAERLLLQTVASGNPEGAGAAWWPDFADFVVDTERRWATAAAAQGSRPL